MEIRDIYARRLRVALIKKNMKAVDLAKAIGTSEANISRYLAAKATPTVKISVAIAETLGVSLAWMAGYGDEEMFVNPSLEQKRRAVREKINRMSEEEIDRLARIIDVL